MPGPPAPFTTGKVLIVEGKTDWHFFLALCRHLGIDGMVDIREFGGTSKLRPYLRTMAAASGFRSSVRSLGIVRDAESDPKAAAAAVAEAVKAAGFSPELRTHSFVTPDANSPGNIETLCLRSVEDHPLRRCVDEYVGASTAVGIEWPVGYGRHKGLVQVYLAAGQEPQPHAGIASHRGSWPWASPAFNEVAEFVRSL